MKPRPTLAELGLSTGECRRRCQGRRRRRRGRVRSANRTLVLVSGGGRAGDDAMAEKARQSLEAGATGLIFGRNVWQREHDESLSFVARLREMLAKYPSGGGH